MSETHLTRRESLRKMGTAGIAVVGSLSGCTTISNLKSTVAGESDADSPRYTMFTPPVSETAVSVPYSVRTMQPARFDKYSDQLADSVLSVSNLGSHQSYYAQTGFTSCSVADGYETHELHDAFGREGDQLSSYRGFQRYDGVFGGDQMAMFSGSFKYILPGINTDDLESLSRELIDLHHGDGEQWRDNRDSYAKLISHLPQGLQTTLFPDAYKDSKASFGQTVLLDEESGELTLRTVIVYDEDVTSIESKVEQELLKGYLGDYWISAPSVSVRDTVAIIEEDGPISEGGN